MRLTPRELEVVELIARDGLQYQTVARTLGISVWTVRAHVRRVADRMRSPLPQREAVIALYYSEVARQGSAPASD